MPLELGQRAQDSHVRVAKATVTAGLASLLQKFGHNFRILGTELRKCSD